ncbi:MAG TPA: AMP-binding protein [Dissulfurispiraceae bacterium]|nr:AMP-binding protein [Dissulfurispiraceae bacterium]
MIRKTPLEQWIASKIGATDIPLSRAAIESYQLRTLRETIQWAADRSQFYRKRLRGCSAAIRSLDDLKSIPFTTADDLRHGYLRFLCTSQNEIERIVTLPTSGTTGEPKRICFTADEQESIIDFFHHGMATLTKPGDRVLILLPGGRPGSVGDLLVSALARLGAVGIPHGPVDDPHSTLRIMARGRVDILIGIPTQVLALARTGQELAAPPKRVLLSTDYVSDAVMRALEALWHCEVFAHYGMTEMGFGGGVQCEARDGFHMREADLYFEIVDPLGGRQLADGEYGEVVFTTLTRHGMPLIRYRTGDISRFLPDACRCGTVLKSLDRVECRMAAQKRISTGEEIGPPDLEEAIFPISGVLDFSAALSSQNGKEHLSVAIFTLTPHKDTIAQEVLDALGSVNAIRNATAGGTLSISIEVNAATHANANRTAKRIIADEQSIMDAQLFTEQVR